LAPVIAGESYVHGVYSNLFSFLFLDFVPYFGHIRL
jgi:hypothetical protein